MTADLRYPVSGFGFQERQQASRFRMKGAGIVAGLFCFASVLNAATLTVGSGQTYATPSADDTIEVYDGTYAEALTIGKQGLTLRAAAGQSPVISPASGTALSINAANVTIDGFEITGSGVTVGISTVPSTGLNAKILNNWVHDLSTVAVTIAGISAASADVLVGTNRISNLGAGATGPYVTGIGVSGKGCVVQDNLIENCNARISGSYFMFGISGANSTIQRNTTRNITSSNYLIMLYLYATCTNSTIQGNTIYGKDSFGIVHEGMNLASGSRKNFINANHLMDCRIGFRCANGGATDNVFVNNTVLDTSLYGLMESRNNMLTDNAVVQGAQSTLFLQGNATFTNNRFSANALLQYGAPNSGVRNDVGPNIYEGNFYAKSQTGGGYTNGAASAPPFTAPSNVGVIDIDTMAVTGYWARAFVRPDTAATDVGNGSNMNALGQRTKLVYNTTFDPGKAATNGAGCVLFDIHANLRGEAGLPPRERLASVGRTLRVAHRFTDGTFMMTVRLAYDRSALPYPKQEHELNLYTFDVRDYANQGWRLAVEGNRVNGSFPANDVQRILGPPDSVLGHYGVDTANGVVWANVNFMGDFGAFQPPPATGTVVLIR